MAEVKMSSAARKEYRGATPEKSIIGIRIPRVRLTKIGASSISLPSPPRMLLLVGTYIALFMLMAGIIYILIREPIALGSSGGRPLYFYPSMNESFIMEGFIASTFLFISGAGAIMTYQASLQMMNRSYAVKLLIIGIVMSFVSFMILQYIISVKIG